MLCSSLVFVCAPERGCQHGFARNVNWDIASTHGDGQTSTLVLELKPSDYSRNMWDYNFLITFKVCNHLTYSFPPL